MCSLATGIRQNASVCLKTVSVHREYCMPTRKYLAVPQMADVALSVQEFSTDATVYQNLTPHMLPCTLPPPMCNLQAQHSFMLTLPMSKTPRKCIDSYVHTVHSSTCHAVYVNIPLITLNGIEARSLSNALCLSVVTIIMAD